jgi:Fe-S-cluster containining protein
MNFSISSKPVNPCQKTCLGFPGNHGGCCTIGNRDYIIGPIYDHQETLKRVQEHFPDVEVTWSDLFIGYEEGRKLFPEKSFWQEESNYPCMRIFVDEPNHPCVFYNKQIKCCSIHKAKSDVCTNYFCDYLKSS